MTNIRVTTEVVVTDNQGRHIATLSRSDSVNITDNLRYLNTYTRGLCQQLEHSISDMIVADWGDTPK